MTSSSKRDELPPALSSMWRLCKLGYSREPGLLLAALSLALLSALPDALLALWFKLIADGVLNANWRLVRIAAVALGVSATARLLAIGDWFCLLRLRSDCQQPQPGFFRRYTPACSVDSATR